MPGIVHFAAIAVGVVVCAFIGTQLATLRGLHVRSIEAGIAAGKGALRGVAGDGSQPNRDVRSAPRTRNRHPAAPSTTHGHTDEDADEDDPDAAADADDGSDSGGGERPPKRVALAFYGLTRSLHYTIDSIRDNIFAPLKEAGYEYDVFLHTYDLARLEGRRSRESAVLNTTEWRLLQPDYVEVANQDKFLRDHYLPIQACKTFHTNGAKSASTRDFYNDGWQSVNNLLCQLNSISQVTSMWRATRVQYHAVLYLRPDMLYNCPVPVQHLDNLHPNKIYIADFHHWRGYNDRFAMGTPRVAGAWGERLNFALATCMEDFIHAERLVKDLIEHYHFDLELVDFSFFRVRATGTMAPQDVYGKAKHKFIPRCDPDKLVPFMRRYEKQKAEARKAAAAKAKGGHRQLRGGTA